MLVRHTLLCPRTLLLTGESDPSKIIKVMANEGKSGEPQELAYTNCKVIGNGSFGVVFQAKLVSNNEDAAIKKVLQDKRFKVTRRLPYSSCHSCHHDCRTVKLIVLTEQFLARLRTTFDRTVNSKL